MRLAEEIGFVLEIVFDDQLVQPFCLLEQSLSPLHGHRGRGGGLVTGRYIDQLGRVEPAADDHAVFVDRLVLDPRILQAQQLANLVLQA